MANAMLATDLVHVAGVAPAVIDQADALKAAGFRIALELQADE